MSLQLFAHPFSSYCQKVLIALYENDVAFRMRLLSPDDPATSEELQRLWPMQRFPLLLDGERAVMESSIIIEYLQQRHAGPVKLIPEAAEAALEVRMLDRFFDWYVMTPMQKPVLDSLRPEGHRDGYGVDEAKRQLERGYAWLDEKLAGRTWAAGESFSLADCAAAPSLFYADWVHPIDGIFGNLRAYRQRLLARPSVARAVDEARPYRPLFPLGAPDRD
ncbi:glutathione S-transferase family protein [Metapseudomonas lalkuanensis]|uniref:glutathione S-transferase family protein n=1 Tax=Metapseudomonas lalkuanensis TaxID=2604832 RepID=UPI001CF16164|nr:glutathione S-transferase family protein [Pseudomonas lalkuanensis]UCO95987.1 glutathione S-transferase family protein [Pseudomonas lalkuanensis]